MTARRSLALLLVLALAVILVRPVAAEGGDEAPAAGSADAGAGGSDASAAASVKPAKTKAKGQKKAAKKKQYDYEQSKYKAYKELVADDAHSYRFDERGNPIPVGGKKKKAAASKKKKKSEEAPACEAGDTCQDSEPAAGGADGEAKTSEAPAEE